MFSHAIPSMAQTVQVCTGVFPRLMLDHLCQLWCCYVLMLLASCFLPNPLPCFFTNLRSALRGTRWCFPQGRVFKHNRDNRKTVPKMKGGFVPWPRITSIPLSLFHFRSWRICVVWAAPWNAWCWWIIRQFRWHCALTTVSSSQAGPVDPSKRLSSAQDIKKRTFVNAGNNIQYWFLATIECNRMQCKKKVVFFCQGSLWTYCFTFACHSSFPARNLQDSRKSCWSRAFGVASTSPTVHERGGRGSTTGSCFAFHFVFGCPLTPMTHFLEVT